MKKYLTIDGGTTNTRVTLVSDGRVDDQAKIAMGARNCIGGTDTLKQAILAEIDNLCLRNSIDIQEIDAIIASGMITSEYGLYHLDHISAPAGIPELHRGIRRVENALGSLPCHFIPGVKQSSGEALDMMRGEETEIFGLPTGEYGEDTVIVLPGSHSKHIRLDGKGKISAFRTLITGEAISAMAEGTILKGAVKLGGAAPDREAILAGYDAAREHGLYEALFRVRTNRLLLGKDERESNGFFLGAMLSDEIASLAGSGAKRAVIGGKTELREPLAVILRERTDIEVITLSDGATSEATALGAVKIYEFDENPLHKDTERVIEESARGFGQDNAKTACKIRYYPKDSRFTEEEVLYQGCPTVAVTRGGRIFIGWYGGGVKEPSLEHFNLLKYSDDGGESFSEPLLVIESDVERAVHALDIQLWTAPNGALWLFWVQNNALPLTENEEYMMTANTVDKLPVVKADGYIFPDMRHTCWCAVCDDPDADAPVFSEPRLIGIGFLRCKPLVLDSGRWIFFNYDQLTKRYGYTVSDDEGRSFTRLYGAEKLATSYDESMAYQLSDGSVRMLSRNRHRELAETVSTDGGLSWSKASLTGIPSPDTRFFISRTPSGRIILINNDMREERERMSVWLSEDDGASWKYKKLVDDPTHHLTYPDADFHGGRIYLVYDRGRRFENEIHLLSFTEEDVMDPNTKILKSRIISKPKNPGIGDLKT